MADPLLTEQAIAEIDAELAPLKADLLRGEHLAVALGELRQQRINQANAQIERAHVEGLGELTARIDRKLYVNLGLRFGFEAWSDPAFLDSVLAKNDGMRIRSRSRKLTVRMPGLGEPAHPAIMGNKSGATGRGASRLGTLFVES